MIGFSIGDILAPLRAGADPASSPRGTLGPIAAQPYFFIVYAAGHQQDAWPDTPQTVILFSSIG
jgi:hypothetical protein